MVGIGIPLTSDVGEEEPEDETRGPPNQTETHAKILIDYCYGQGTSCGPILRDESSR